MAKSNSNKLVKKFLSGDSGLSEDEIVTIAAVVSRLHQAGTKGNVVSLEVNERATDQIKDAAKVTDVDAKSSIVSSAKGTMESQKDLSGAVATAAKHLADRLDPKNNHLV